MIHLGDITKINGATAPAVDVIIGGSPCQDLSMAGKREGLAGERSGLYMEQLRVIKEMRHNDELRGRTGEFIRPRYMVWENVPGAFSCNKGADFSAVLTEAVRVIEPEAPDVPVPEKGWPTAGVLLGDEWSIAWRILDAQYWGVPQRRRRIALICDFGGHTAEEILFVSKSVSGHPEPGRTERQGTTGDPQDGTGEPVCYPGVGITSQRNGNNPKPGSPCHTLTDDSRNYVVKQVCYGISPYHSNCMLSDNPHSGYYEANTARTLDALNCGYPGCNQGGMAIVTPAYGLDSYNQTIYEDRSQTLRASSGGDDSAKVFDARGNGDGKVCPTITGDHQNRVTDYSAICIGNGQTNQGYGDKVGALNCMHDQQAILCPDKAHTLRAKANMALREDMDTLVCKAVDCRNGTEANVNGTMQAKPGGGYSLNCNQVIRDAMTVRRLTPLECERLQGYPDGWTDIGEWVDSKGKKHKPADSPRYKALGNSIAIPPWRWVLKRLCAQYERTATMASLFDGIGGFPLIWEGINGNGSCLWASEIEEFPMAVTKQRFGG